MERLFNGLENYTLFDTMLEILINRFISNGRAHPYHLGVSTVILGASGVILHFYFFLFQ